MIRLLVKLATRFKIIDVFMGNLLFAYSVSKNQDNGPEKAILIKRAIEEIKKISEYEKHGEASGYKAPRVVGMGR